MGTSICRLWDPPSVASWSEMQVIVWACDGCLNWARSCASALHLRDPHYLQVHRVRTDLDWRAFRWCPRIIGGGKPTYLCCERKGRHRSNCQTASPARQGTHRKQLNRVLKQISEFSLKNNLGKTTLGGIISVYSQKCSDSLIHAPHTSLWATHRRIPCLSILTEIRGLPSEESIRACVSIRRQRLFSPGPQSLSHQGHSIPAFHPQVGGSTIS